MILHISKKEVPTRIQMFVEKILIKQLKTYKVDNSGKYIAQEPWHESDRTYTQMFKLSGSLPLISAIPTEFSFMRSGLEGDGNKTGKELEGTVEIPVGFVFVEVGIYPERCIIYTTDTKFLPDLSSQSLSEQELMILHYAQSLISSARPRFDERAYSNLISQGFLTRKKSITIKGRNVLSFNVERLKNIS